MRGSRLLDNETGGTKDKRKVGKMALSHGTTRSCTRRSLFRCRYRRRRRTSLPTSSWLLPACPEVFTEEKTTGYNAPFLPDFMTLRRPLTPILYPSLSTTCPGEQPRPSTDRQVIRLIYCTFGLTSISGCISCRK